ncbi:MAG: RNA polymerase sigma factor [Acidobacteriota bacterium]
MPSSPAQLNALDSPLGRLRLGRRRSRPPWRHRTPDRWLPFRSLGTRRLRRPLFTSRLPALWSVLSAADRSTDDTSTSDEPETPRVAEDPLVALLVGYQRGEAEAFDALYDRLLPPLRRYLAHLTLDRSRTDDLLQETFLQIHRSRHTYLAPRPVRPWAFGIARHVYLMDVRRGTRRRRHELPQDDEVLELIAPVTGTAFEDKDLLRRAMAKLPADRREILLLHHALGLSHREIAGILGIRVGAAKVRAHRAMLSLRVLSGVERE